MSSSLSERLGQLKLRRLSRPFVGEAAVLVPLFEQEGEICLLLTKRSETVRTHKGHVSFPGGMRSGSDETLLETALRETEEELGIDQTNIEILGPFHQYLAATDALVQPYIGRLPAEIHFSPDSREVSYLLPVPLKFFQAAKPREETYWRGDGSHGILYFYDFDGEMIWGLTAAIIRDFLGIV